MASDPLGLINSTAGANPALRPQSGAKSGAANASSFKQTLMDEMKRVNDLQQEAETAIEDLATNKRDDFANVMIAKQKADTAFKMLLQVRNKMMDAYQEIKDVRV
jgi:flagellar hook-basal body complex protein FliE